MSTKKAEKKETVIQSPDGTWHIAKVEKGYITCKSVKGLYDVIEPSTGYVISRDEYKNVTSNGKMFAKLNWSLVNGNFILQEGKLKFTIRPILRYTFIHDILYEPEDYIGGLYKENTYVHFIESYYLITKGKPGNAYAKKVIVYKESTSYA